MKEANYNHCLKTIWLPKFFKIPSFVFDNKSVWSETLYFIGLRISTSFVILWQWGCCVAHHLSHNIKSLKDTFKAD